MAVKASVRNLKPIKILMTADAVGGVWQYSIDLIRGLGADAEFLLATFGPRASTGQKEQLKQLPPIKLCESDYALEWMNDPWRDVDAAGEWLLSLQAQYKADLIHLNGYALAVLPWQKPVIVAAHSCVYSWWHAVHHSRPDAQWAEYYRRTAEGLSACDAVVAPSRFMAGEIEWEYSVPAAKVQVIYNFSSAPVPAATVKEPFCLAAGRLWDQAKNLSILTEIAPYLDWPLYLAGEKGDSDAPAADSRSLHLLGHLPHAELLEYMARAGVFLHPALYEPFGLSILEAARCGCCLVLADIPSLRELWSGAALFLDSCQPEEWISHLNQLFADFSEIVRWGELARKHAARYSEQSSIDAYKQLYRRKVPAA